MTAEPREALRPMPASHGLRGRDAEIGAAREVLQEGRSVMLVGRPGVGKTAVARVLVGARTRGGPHSVTGAPELAEEPLAAAAMAGLLPAGGEGGDPGTRVAMAVRGLSAVAGDRPGPVVLVEGPQHLDAYTVTLLAAAARRRALRLVLPTMVGTSVPAFTALVVDGVVERIDLPPLPAPVLRRLAPADADPADVEQALSAADGAPLWFLQSLRAGWFGAPLPMPPLLREIADGQLDAYGPEVADALALTAHAGLVPAVTLGVAASPDAVRAAVDAELLEPSGDDLLTIRNPFLQARLRERASLHAPDLEPRLRSAGERTGAPAPALPRVGRPRAAVLRSMLARAPHEVLARLADLDAPVPADLRLVQGEALLRTGDLAGARATLRSLLAVEDQDVRAEAVLSLSYLLAHVDQQVEAASRMIEGVIDGLDPDLAVRVAARQVTVEAYHPHPTTDARLTRWEAMAGLSADSRLEVAKARSLVDWTHRSELPEELPEEIERLLDKTSASAAERWSCLAGVYWDRLFRDGFPSAMAMAADEVATARRSRDLSAVGSWWALVAGALGYAGHTAASVGWARRSLAAVAPLDRFGVAPFPRSVLALAATRDGDPATALAQVAGVPRPLANPLGELVLTTVEAEATAAGPARRVLVDRALGTYEGMGRQAMVWMLLAGSPVGGRGVPIPDGRPAGGVVQAWNDSAGLAGEPALEAARSLAGRGFVALALRAVQALDWTARPVSEQVQAQHVAQVLQAIVHPAAGPVEGLVPARQLEVAALAATGRTDRDIAEALSLSVRTVSNHLSRLYRDTGIGGREDLNVLLRPVAVWQPAGEDVGPGQRAGSASGMGAGRPNR